jgi:hypothetical protein
VKLIGRLLWLLLGLIYRLVVLVLFEKWLPFPDRALPEVERAPEQARKPKQPKPRKPSERRAPGLFAPRERALANMRDHRSAKAHDAAPSGRASRFAAQSSELSPEEAARREGEHWQNPHRVRAVVPAAPRQRETLLGLLRDRRAVRDAVVLGAALGRRRAKP